jgi:hypothetical protein
MEEFRKYELKSPNVMWLNRSIDLPKPEGV